MSKERLQVYDDSGVYRIAWYFPDEGEIGMRLGEDIKDLNKSGVEADHKEASLAVQAIVGVELDSEGFWWDSKTQAQAALRIAKRAIEELEGSMPWPEWAKRAEAHGWRPPKGWKP